MFCRPTVGVQSARSLTIWRRRARAAALLALDGAWRARDAREHRKRAAAARLRYESVFCSPFVRKSLRPDRANAKLKILRLQTSRVQSKICTRLADLATAFDALDYDKDGLLSRAELAALLRTVHFDADYTELTTLVNEIDGEPKRQN